MTKQTTIYENSHKGHRAETDKQYGFIKEIVDGYTARLEHFISKHDQVSVMQFVASAPASIPPDQTNKAIGDSLRAIKKTMNNNDIDFQAGWVKEIAEDSETRCHYHIGAIVESKKCQSAVGIAKSLKKHLIKKAQDEADVKTVSVHYCKPDSDKYNEQDLHPIEKASAIKIRQDKPHADKQIVNAKDWLKYVAKPGMQKDRLPPGRGYDFTRLPKESSKRTK